MSEKYKFTYKTIDDVRLASGRLGVDIPLSTDTSVLARPVNLTSRVTLKNSLAIHPMEGFDGNTDGSPSELTKRRYDRFARGGAGLIWFEATSVCPEGRSSSHQLWIHENNVDEYARLVDDIHKKSDGAIVIAQLTHSGRFSKPENKPAPIIAYHNPLFNKNFDIPADYPVVTDDYLDSLREKYVNAAILAKKAGFDGVDIKSCHRYLMSELLSAYQRDGRYGGSYENRTRLLRETVRDVISTCGGDFIVATRMSISDCVPYPYGFCTRADGSVDLTEAKQLAAELRDLGMNLFNVSMGTPYYNPHVNRPYDSGGYEPPENPLCGVARLINCAFELRAAVPGMIYVGTGYSYLRSIAPYAAAGALSEDKIDIVGFGRMAFAYPDFACDMINGQFNSRRSCISCGKCVELMRAIAPAGCPVRDSLYLPIYKEHCMRG